VNLVRHATPHDVDALVRLAEEMDKFYGSTEVESLAVRRQQIRDALFGDPPAAYALLAVDDSAPVGFATYSFLWPAVGLTRSLYLKELFVTATGQRKGVGKQLMAMLTDVARRHACSRIEWTTDEDNVGAQAFYAALGLKQNPSKLFYRLDDPG